MSLEIDYVSDGFPTSSPVADGPGVLTTTWSELLGAAITVGRPSRHYVFRYGRPSQYEALFRLSLVRMALEQRGPLAKRLRRTTAARTLDPSEKGAVSYFLGLTLCKLFAEKLLTAPWMLHLDVFRPSLNPVLAGRSRPDLVGQMMNGEWIALEAKGRVSAPNKKARDKAKQQAQRLVSVNGTTPTYRIGGVAFFRNEVLQFYWKDPEPDPAVRNPIEVDVEEGLWQSYYAPILDLIRSDPQQFVRMRKEPTLMRIEDADIEIGIHPVVLRALEEERWHDARNAGSGDELEKTDFAYRADGIAIRAGESWLRPYVEAQEGAG